LGEVSLFQIYPDLMLYPLFRDSKFIITPEHQALRLDKVGFAVVGLGVIGQVHAYNISRLDNCRLVAVVDQVRERAESLARELGVTAYLSLDEAVRDPMVESVIIATPSYLHAPQTLYALLHGKHVLVEKPMSTTLQGGRLIIETAERKGLQLGVVFQERYLQTARKLKEIITAGSLGSIYLFEAELKWWRGEKEYYRKDILAESWRGYWETEGGGVLMNQAIHTLDLLLWLGGDIYSVSGYVANILHPSIEVEDVAVAVIKFRSGALCTISATVNTQPVGREYRCIRVFGSRGQAELRDSDLMVWTEEGERRYEAGVISFGDLHRLLLADFADCLRSGRPFPVDGREGLRGVELIKAIYRSSEYGEMVTMPLAQRV